MTRKHLLSIPLVLLGAFPVESDEILTGEDTVQIISEGIILASRSYEREDREYPLVAEEKIIIFYQSKFWRCDIQFFTKVNPEKILHESYSVPWCWSYPVSEPLLVIKRQD